eukprot:119445-Pyramimonas_sp.AAC.1
MAYESSDEDTTVEASPSEVERNLEPPPEIPPGNRPSLMGEYPQTTEDLIEMECQAFVQAFIAREPDTPFIPP